MYDKFYTIHFHNVINSCILSDLAHAAHELKIYLLKKKKNQSVVLGMNVLYVKTTYF